MEQCQTNMHLVWSGLLWQQKPISCVFKSKTSVKVHDMAKSVQPKTTQIHHELDLWLCFVAVTHNPELSSKVESVYHSRIGAELFLATICDSSSKKFVTLLWLPQVPTLMCTNIQETHCCMRDFSWGEPLHTHTHLSAPVWQPVRNVINVLMPNLVNQWMFLIRDPNRSMGKELVTNGRDNSRATIIPSPTWMKTPPNLSASPAGISAVRIPENITLCYLATQSLLPQQVLTSFTVF